MRKILFSAQESRIFYILHLHLTSRMHLLYKIYRRCSPVKRFYAMVAIFLIIVACVPISAGAAIRDDVIVQPMYLYTSEVRATLNISSSGTASCVGKIKGWANDSSITMTVTLYKKSGTSWSKVTSWSDSATGVSSFTLSESCSVDAGTYKVVVTGMVTDPGVGAEDVSKSSTEVIYE